MKKYAMIFFDIVVVLELLALTALTGANLALLRELLNILGRK